MNFGKNNGPEISKILTEYPSKKEPNRRDVLKGLAQGVGAFGVVNLVGIATSQALLRSTEMQSAGPLVENIGDINISKLSSEAKRHYIGVCEGSLLILDSIKTEKQIAEINDGKVPDYKRNDLVKTFGFMLGTSLATLGGAISARTILKKLEEKGVDVSKATPALILSAATTLLAQEVGNDKMEERRYMEHPTSENEEDMYILKAIFSKELDSGKKITKKDINNKIDYFLKIRDTLKKDLAVEESK